MIYIFIIFLIPGCIIGFLLKEIRIAAKKCLLSDKEIEICKDKLMQFLDS